MTSFDRVFKDLVSLLGRGSGLGKQCAIVVCGSIAWTSIADAQSSTVLRHRVEPWGLYCVETSTNPGLNDCSLVTAVASKEDPEISVKLAVAVVSTDGDMELTMLVPRVRYVGPGIAISNGTGSLVRTPFDECIDNACTSVVRLDGSSLKRLLTGGKSWIEYQVSEDQTTRLALELGSFGDAITALYRAVGIGSNSDGSRVASAPVRSTLAKVRVDIEREAAQAGGILRPLSERCEALLSSVTFTVTAGLRITDQQALDRWLKESRVCMEGVVAKVHTIPATGASDKDDSNIAQMQAYQVFDALREKSGAGQVSLVGHSDAPVRADAR